MEPSRYTRIRDLFLAAEELPSDQQEDFLRSQTGDDQQLFREVLSLLAEHDADLARREGERATPVPYPISAGSSIVPVPPNPVGSSASQDSSTNKDPNDLTNSDETDTGRRAGDADSEETIRRRAASGHRRRTKPKTKPGKAPTTRRGDKVAAAQATQHGSEHTRVSQPGVSSRGKTLPHSVLWKERARRTRRWNTGWFWLAAVLPTALVGWWTYANVAANVRSSIRNELAQVSDSVALTTERFLVGHADLVESWSRQPEIRHAILELVEFGREDDPVPVLKSAAQTSVIHSQLRQLSGIDEIKFVVWDRSGMTLASWLDDRADVGNLIAPERAANLARVMRGQTVLFGPRRLTDNGDGVVPETDQPVMAVLVPIQSSADKVVACLLVRGFRMFDKFDQMFQQAAEAGDLDAYAVDGDGIMVTNSPRAIARAKRVSLELQPNAIAAVLRVSDPGKELAPSNVGTVRRQAQPLTHAAADASIGGKDVRVQPYNNYAGVPVVGAWSWNPDWQLGIVIERDAKTAFAPARFVRFGFLTLGVLLSLTAFAAAAQIAKQSARVHAAVHPLSRYDLISELGRGGMGVVYRARHRQLGRDTALKVLRGDRRSEEDRLRFDREAKLAATLSNPHSVMIYDYGIADDGEAFCVMEFLKGVTLHEVVARSGHQPFGRVLTILRQICDSLAEAHALGLLHRDIKPQNIMLSLDPTVGDWAVVFDFGLAKALTPDVGSYQTTEMVWAGTPMYMSPERYRDPAGMDPRSDLYSVGCVAYFLLSGRPPYLECDPESLFALVLSEQPISISTHRDESVPHDIIDLVMRCMAKNPADRFQSIDQFSNAIDQLRTQYAWTVDEARKWWSDHGNQDEHRA